MIKKGSITLMASDFEKTVKFYTEIVGMKLVRRFGNDWAEIEIEGLHIGLHSAHGKPTTSSSIQLGFSVDDVDREIEELKKKGIENFRVVDNAQVRLASFSDPDGNVVYVSRMKEKFHK